MQVNLTILTDNTASYGFLAEWGWSALVRAGGVSVLMDTGFSWTAVHNAQLLGIDLRELHAIVLSHGHADHSGGLREVLLRSGGKRIFAHPAALETKSRRSKDAPERHIGMLFRREELEALGAEFHLSTKAVEPAPSMLTSGEVPMESEFEEVDPTLYHRTGRDLAPDPLADDLSLAIRTEEGLVILCGCAHRGPVNIIRHFQRLTKEERVYAVVGGLHLVSADDKRILETIRALRAMGVKRLACSHCTGFRAMARIAEEFGDDFAPLAAGRRLTYPEG